MTETGEQTPNREPVRRPLPRSQRRESQVSPVRRRAEELLADGEWHSFEKLVARLVRLVPPGQAARRAEEMRKHSAGRVRQPPEKRVMKRDLDAIIRSGARSIVWDILRADIFEITPKGRLENPGDRRIRMVPKEVPALSSEHFTETQLEALQWAATGLRADDVSIKMGTPGRSVGNNPARSHYSFVMRKLEVTNMAAAVFRARELGILPPAPEMDGIDLQLAQAMLTYKADNGSYLAEKIDVPVDVMERSRRRLYGRFGVNTMPLLRAELVKWKAQQDKKRDEDLRRRRTTEARNARLQVVARAAALYANANGIKDVAEQIGYSYTATRAMLMQAKVLRVRGSRHDPPIHRTPPQGRPPASREPVPPSE